MTAYGTRNEIASSPFGSLCSLRAPRNDMYGYTLIEVIIVLTIIAIFAGIFMFFSGDYVSRARLDIAADTVLAAFSDSQEEVKNGVRAQGGVEAQCIGLKVETDGVFRVFAPYSAASDVPCDIASYSVSDGISLEKYIYFRDFWFDSDVFQPPLVVLYEPPHGKVRIFTPDTGSGMALRDKNVTFLVSYGQEGDLFQKIKVDAGIGRASFSP